MSGKYPGVAPYVADGGDPAFGEVFITSKLRKKNNLKKKRILKMNKKH